MYKRQEFKNHITSEQDQDTAAKQVGVSGEKGFGNKIAAQDCCKGKNGGHSSDDKAVEIADADMIYLISQNDDKCVKV